MASEPGTYPGYRFPAEIIRYVILLYSFFCLSFRDPGLILSERSVAPAWVLARVAATFTGSARPASRRKVGPAGSGGRECCRREGRA